MSQGNLKVLFVAAEVAPFSMMGGLGQVGYFLPRGLLKKGVDVRIFTPRYAKIDPVKFPLKMVVEGLRVPTGEPPGTNNPTELICNIKSFGETKKGEPTVYFLENQEYYEQRANVYGYSDDHIRFGLLSRGALEFIKNDGFVPDLVHCNDWHTGYLINFLEQESKESRINKIARLMSVHNLYQGNFDFAHCSEMDYDDGKSPLASFYTEQFYKQNALKRGVIYADAVNTVSETYAREIMTDEYGKGMHNLFRELRGKLFGVLNGLDYREFNPQTDKIIKANYSLNSLDKRAENKKDLQRQFGLDEDPDVPILSFWGRIDTQKGVTLMQETMHFLLSEFDAQLVMVGPIDDQFRDYFLQLEKDFPGRVGTHFLYNPILPRKVSAGGDIVLLPSKYEPGGIVALEAMRYGCVPVVRATGGLADSVTDYNPAKNIGTGFTFKKFTRESFIVAVVRALETYKDKDAWNKIVRRAMQQDFSWGKVAEKYLDLYQRAVEFRKEALLPNPPTAFRQITT